MSQLIELEIVVPALKEAIEQLSLLSLEKVGLDITEFPFWMAVIGFPLAVFDTCTKHIATALNVLLGKFHVGFRELIGILLPLVFLIGGLATFILYLGFDSGEIKHQITQTELTSLFYYMALTIGSIACLLFIISLSRLTGHGNYVTGIGFLLGAGSIYIEMIQEYGTQGVVVGLMVLVITLGLWLYGKNHNDKLASKSSIHKGTAYAKPYVSSRR